MDIGICNIQPGQKLLFSGAVHPLYLVRKNTEDASPPAEAYTKNNHYIQSIQTDNFSIGDIIFERQDNVHFHNQEITLRSGDHLYMCSDGYEDQFGGPNNEKFSNQQFQQLLLDIQDQSLQQQHDSLDQAFEDWKSGYRQIDDVLVMGIKI